MPPATAPKPAKLTAEQKVAADQRHAQTIAELQANSFEVRLRAATRGCSVPLLDGVSKSLTADKAAHDADVAKLRKDADDALDRLAGVLADAEATTDYSTVFSGADGMRIDRAIATQSNVRLWEVARELAERQVAELNQRVPKAHAASAEVLETVASELNAIGYTPEAMPAARDHSAAAKRQFDALVRSNPRAAAALAKAKGALDDLMAAKGYLHARVIGLEAAKKFMKDAALSLVGQ